MRLDYFLAHATGCSRKEAKRLIAKKRVRVPGLTVVRPTSVVTGQETIELDGQSLTLPEGPFYLMMNKPAGVVSARHDSEHPTVLDGLPGLLRQSLHPVGRLDRDTTGLILLSSDGQWSHRITSPRHDCDKAYRVGIAEPLSGDAKTALESGVQLKSDPTPTRPARVEQLGDREIRLILTEGRYHQVKRMLAAVGNRVISLHRERIGPLTLDPALSPGDWRHLTPEEVQGVWGDSRCD